MKICVNAIAKNEAQFIERFCASAKDADLIVIADTGSTDNTAALAKKNGAKVFDICISPWRFDLARNAALALVPADVDIVVSLDLDEVLQEGWREEVERVWTANTTRMRYKFDWGSGISFYSEKIFLRKGYKWHHPCHEYPVPDRITEVWAQSDKLLVKHLPDPTKSRGQYLDLLKLAVTEDPNCPRNAFYYARELTFYDMWPEAITALNKYLENPLAVWANERCYAYRLLGRAYENLGLHSLALENFHNACKAAPTTREPWCDLAAYYYRQSLWHDCLEAIEKCVSIVDRELSYTAEPAVWGALPYDYGSIAAWHLGKHEDARVYLKKALEYDPNNYRLLNNQNWIGK
jgi:glycosyltransferase involved in cell wall biosynthesis